MTDNYLLKMENINRKSDYSKVHLGVLKCALWTLCILYTISAGANSQLTEWVCMHGHVHRLHQLAPGKPGDPSFRKYAPHRHADYKHLKLEITPDFEDNSLNGTATIDLVPIGFPMKKLSLNAVDLDVSSVKANKEVEGWHNSEKTIDIVFKQPIPVGKKLQVVIKYFARPEDGLFFRTPSLGYSEQDTQLWTQGEPISHRHWFPSHDFPNERMTTEIICHVPEGMTVLSNGKLKKTSLNKANNLKTFHWIQDKPHVNYLVSLVAGYFAHKEDSYNGIPLAFYAPPSEKDQIDNSFQDTKAILEFFEKEIGVPYPWDKYYNVCAIDYMFGGMENTSLTTLTVRTLFTDEFENLKSSRSLDAHELAHQWFGDLVTCKDWSHLWLNEGFATYYSLLFDKKKLGNDYFKFRIFQNGEGITRNSNDETPIVFNAYGEPIEQFSFRAYPKGAWVLHMLRSRIGEEKFRKAVKNYLQEFQYQSVVTENLASHFEKISGLALDRYFDQWVFLAGTPEFKAQYSWDVESKLAKIRVEQVQKISEKRPFFHVPLKLRFTVDGKQIDKIIDVNEKIEIHYFKFESEPEIVRFDPEVELLAKINFKPTKRIIEHQIKDASDVIGRLLAVRALGKDSKAQEMLVSVIENDSFYGVRVEAVKKLGQIKTEENLKILNKFSRDSDARVRESVVKAISSFYSEESYAILKKLTQVETNPQILSHVFRALPKFGNNATRQLLFKGLRKSSYRQTTEKAILDAFKKLDQESTASGILKYIKDYHQSIESNTLVQGLNTLAFLNRNLNQSDKLPTRQFLQGFLGHKKEAVTRGAIQALGTLGDSHAIAVLESFSTGDDNNATTKAAKDAISKIRKETPENPQLDLLRKQVQSYEAEVQSLNKELDSLKTEWADFLKAQNAKSK